jgi:hypothetical protein
VKTTNLVVVQVTGNIDVINPDVVGRLDAEGITSLSEDLADLQVPDDDVLSIEIDVISYLKL